MDKEIQRLIARDRTHPLDRLEAHVWHREQSQHRAALASRRLLSWQGAVLAVAVICSASIGVATAHARLSPEVNWFSGGVRLLPTTLLFGSTP
jgi:hypothetical protein